MLFKITYIYQYCKHINIHYYILIIYINIYYSENLTYLEYFICEVLV